MGNVEPLSSPDERPYGGSTLPAPLGQVLPSGVSFSPRISGLAVPLRSLVQGCAETGNRIYHGNFRFGGRKAESRGGLIFDAPVTDSRSREELHGFGWLIHLEATGLELGRVHARALVSDWLRQDRHRQPGANALPVVCRRLMSWIMAGPFLVERAEHDFVSAFCGALASHVRDLQLRSIAARSAAVRLDCAIALAAAAVALRGLEPSRPIALELLSERLELQILPDGGHVSRNPAELIRLLLWLVPLRVACEQARIDLPAGFQGALERMFPMLRFFLHGDHGLAIFQGACDPLSVECAALLDADRTKGRPLSNALYSSYMRLSHGDSTVICDTGLPAGERINPCGAASPLAFEFSHSVNRIVINCGAPPSHNRWSAAARLTDAHSTAAPAAELHRKNSRPISAHLGFLRRAPARVNARAETGSIGSIIEACHDCRRAQRGFLHLRRIFLSANGDDLRGEDRFLSAAIDPLDERFTIRFHLHPAVKANLSRGGRSAVLLLPDKSGWTFSARGGDIVLEESICLWGKSGPRHTMQIVLSGCATGEPVNWAFKRYSGQPPAVDEISSDVLPL